MKIKEMCELTGLTDKTVRFYIDNGLITPECKENYLGRRSFTFSKQNLSELEDIATLRKAGFSVAQIKEIQNEKEKSREIIPQLIALKEKQIEENKLINAALSQLESDRAYSVREIAEVLREPAREVEAHEDGENFWYAVIKAIKHILIILWLGASALGLFGVIQSAVWATKRYSSLVEVVNYRGLAISMSSIFVPIIIFFISLSVKKAKKIKNYSLTYNGIIMCLLLLSLFALPIPILGGVFNLSGYGAKTNSPEDYLIITHYIEADEAFYKVFPEQIPADLMQNYYLCNHKKECECKKPEYYYINCLDRDVELYEMYAEWVLDEDAFEAEVDRIYSIGGIERTYEDYTVRFFEYEKDWRGKYCLAFAYNKETKTVRYIYYGGYNPEGKKPYCETVEWII